MITKIKNNVKGLILFVFISTALPLQSQITFVTTQPDSIAFQNQLYEADINITAPNSDTSFYLDVAPSGMTIDENGIISWTPLAIDQGGRVVVRASYPPDVNETITYYVYVSSGFDENTDVVAYWRMDELDGDLLQDSYGSHDAYAANGQEPSNTTGPVKNAKAFDKTLPSAVFVNDHPDLRWDDSQSFSISFWARTAELDQDATQVIMGRNDGYGNPHWWIGIDEDNEPRFEVRNSTTTTENTHLTGLTFYNKTDWHHLVAIHNASNNKIKIYYDGGIEKDSVNFTATSSFGFLTDSVFSMGWLKPGPGDGGNSYPFNGDLDEVILFNKALSETEIEDIYDRGNTGNYSIPTNNFAPIFRGTPDTEATQGEAYSYTVEVSDMEGDALTLSSVILPYWLSFNTGTGELSGTPTNDNAGDTIVRLQVTDAPGDDGFLQFDLTVKNINDDPTIEAISDQTLDEEADFSLQVNADDIDPGDNLDYSISGAAWLNISATGLITGTPATDDTSAYTVTVTVTDDSSATADEIFELDILNINDAPAVTQDSIFNLQEEASRVISLSELSVTDVDNAPGDISLTVQDGSNYSHVGNTITPDDDFTGALTVPVTVQDLDSSVNVNISVNVNNVNDAPVILSYPDAQAYEGQAYSYVFNANDADPGDVLILDYSVPKYPDWLSYNAGTRLLDGTPDINDVGQDTITLSVTDGTATTDTMIIITVNTSNTVPVITSTPVTAVDEDASYIYNITTFDGDGDGIILTASVKPEWLTLNEAQGTLTGIPTNDQVGYSADSVFTIQLMVSDTKQDSTQTFTITVTNINDQPLITGQVADVNVEAEGSVTIELDDLVVEDVDNKPADLSVTVLPGDDYSIAGNTATFNAGVTGLTAVSVRVSDGDLNSGEFDYMVGVGLSAIKTVEQNGNLIKAVYPNPANHYLMMELVSADILNFEIIDITGVRVFEEIIPANYREFSLDVSELHEGIYFYKVYNHTEQQTGSFMIIK